MPPCTVCGRPAAHAVADKRLSGYLLDEDGRLWEAYEPAASHQFCDTHLRAPRVLANPHVPAPPGRFPDAEQALDWFARTHNALALSDETAVLLRRTAEQHDALLQSAQFPLRCRVRFVQQFASESAGTVVGYASRGRNLVRWDDNGAVTAWHDDFLRHVRDGYPSTDPPLVTDGHWQTTYSPLTGRGVLVPLFDPATAESFEFRRLP